MSIDFSGSKDDPLEDDKKTETEKEETDADTDVDVATNEEATAVSFEKCLMGICWLSVGFKDLRDMCAKPKLET